MRLLLDEAQAPATPPSHPRAYIAAWAVAGAAALGAAALAFVHFRETTPATPVIRSTILPPDDATFDFTGGAGVPALSPDGRRIVFGARTADGRIPLWVRSLDGLTAQPLAGTEGATFPFWSPDSEFIAFFADGKLKKIAASGGPSLTLTDAPNGRGGSWSADGVIVFDPQAATGPLLRVSDAGGGSSPVSKEVGSLPWFLPDGQHFLYQDDQTVAGQGMPIRLGSLDGSPSKVLGMGSNPIYAGGHLLFLREGTLLAQPFDTGRLETTGDAVPIAEQVQSVLNSGRVGVFSASDTGLLAYRAGASAQSETLTWFDRSGKQGASVGEAAAVTTFRFSPDGSRVAVGVRAGTASDIWIYDVVRGRRSRFTFDAADDDNPVWSPDGRAVVFRSTRGGRFDLYRKSVDSVGTEELLFADDLNKNPSSWSREGTVLYSSATGSPRTGADVFALPLTPERRGAAVKPSPVLQSPFNEQRAEFSPDGRWILYTSNESQQLEAYATPFPPRSGPGGKVQISTAGLVAVAPRWREDGREVFYVSADRQMMAAEVAVRSGTLEVGEVRSLFSLPGSGTSVFDVTPDGQRFLLLTSPEGGQREPITLIQNWAPR